MTSTGKSRLAIGLVGAGRLGRVYARDLASRIAETKLVAIADPVEAVAKEVAAEFDVPKYYAEPLALIDDPAVDAIVIDTTGVPVTDVVARVLQIVRERTGQP